MNYKMSFTNGGLFCHESLAIADLHADLLDWDKTKLEAFNRNLLQSRIESSAKRNIREVCGRLKCLTEAQLALLQNGNEEERRQVLWLAVCKRYQLVCEFAQEVVREKFLLQDLELSYQDYDVFFFKKAEWSNDLESLTESTQRKIRQVVFRLLREAGILTKDNRIVPAFLSREVIRTISQDSSSLLAIFPVFERDIQEWSK